MDSIGARLQHFIALGTWDDALQLSLYGVRFERRFDRFTVVGIEGDAPLAGQAKQAERPGRRPAVVHAGQRGEMLRKIEAGRGKEGRLRKGDAFEAEAERLAHDA